MLEKHQHRRLRARRRATGWAAAVTFAVALSACTSGGGTEQTATPGGTSAPGQSATGSDETLVVGLPDFAGELSLPWQMSNTEQQIWSQIYDTLIDHEPGTANAVPGLALSWTPNDDYTEWTFKLREGVQFQGGYGEFTSADVKFTLEQAMSTDATGQSAPFVRQNIESVDAPDKYTVVIHTKTPNWQVPSAMTRFEATQFIVSKEYVEKVGAEEASLHPIGTGPYEYVSGVPQQYHDFKAYEGYWGDQPYYRNLEIRLVKNADTALEAVKTGSLDITPLQNGDQVRRAESAGLTLVKNEHSSMTWIILPGQTGEGTQDYCPECPWVGDPDDPASLENAKLVRQALALAIDKEQLVQVAYGNGSIDPMGYWYFPYMSGFSDSWTLQPYDVEKAKQLLADAGYPGGGFTINMWVTNAINTAATQIVAQYWKEIGVNVQQDVIDLGSFQGAMRVRDTERHGSVTPAQGGAPEPSLLMASQSTTTGAYCNLVCNADIDAKLAKITQTLDEAERVKLQVELQDELWEQQYGIGLGWLDWTWAVSDKVHDWPLAPGNKYTAGFQYIS